MGKTTRRSPCHEGCTKAAYIDKEVNEHLERVSGLMFMYRDSEKMPNWVAEILERPLDDVRAEAARDWDRCHRDHVDWSGSANKHFKWESRKNDRGRNRRCVHKVMKMTDYDDEDLDWSRRAHGKANRWNWW